MSDEIRSGVVTDLSFPKPGKGKCKVGGKTVNYWTKAYQSDEESDVSKAIGAAFQSGEPIVLGGDIYEGTGPDGKAYKSFTAKYVTDSGSGSSAKAHGIVEAAASISSAELVNALTVTNRLLARLLVLNAAAIEVEAGDDKWEAQVKFMLDLAQA